MIARHPTELSPAEWATLGVVAEGPVHGYDASRLLAPDGEVGQVWSVSRPLVYRALARLQELGDVEVHTSQPSEAGPNRTVLRATRPGRARLDAWLREPVSHPRDVRSLLLLKLALLHRRGADPSELLAAQRATMVRRISDLDAQADADGFAITVVAWRREFAEAVVRFIDGLDADRTRRK